MDTIMDSMSIEHLIFFALCLIAGILIATRG